MKNIVQYYVLLFSIVVITGCSQGIQLFIDPETKVGEYTCEKNAYPMLLGQVDALKKEILGKTMYQNYENEYKAYKKARLAILEAADVDKNRIITAEEIYKVDIEKIKEGFIKGDLP